MSITKKVSGLAGLLAAFTSIAFGQANCSSPTSSAVIIRAEGTTELLAPLTFTCNTFSATSAGTVNLQVFLSPSLAVTSKILSTGYAEAVAVVSGNATQYNGAVSGSSISFTGIAFPALSPGGNFTLTVSNIRVNATALAVGPGVPPSISLTPFISGSPGTVVPAALPSTQVAFAQNGLGTSVLYKDLSALTTGSNSFSACNGYDPNNTTGSGSALAFVVQVRENFASAFKSAAGEASSVVTSPGNAVSAGTRLAVNFSNVPAGVSLYVPRSGINSTDGGAGSIQVNVSGPGTAFSAAASATGAGVNGLGLTAVPLVSGAGSVTFEVVVGDPNNLDKYNIPVYVVTTANGVTGSTTPITASVSYSPNGSAAIPNFVVASSTVSLTGSTFSVCRAPQSITFSAPASVAFGGPVNLGATASSGLAVDLTSNTLSVCSVSGSTLTLLSTGSCSVTASQPGNANYLAATPVSQTLTVTQGPQTIAFGAVTGATYGSGPMNLAATASSGLTVGFASTTQGVCTVSGSVVSILSAGACSITATQAGNLNYVPATPVTQNITVAPGNNAITFAQLADTMLGFPPFALGATASSGLTVGYLSSTPSVCTVNQATVTLIATGTCTLSASQAGSVNYLGAATITQSFTVFPSPTVSFTSIPTSGQAGTVFGRVSAAQTAQLFNLRLYVFEFIPDYGWVMPRSCTPVSIAIDGTFLVNPVDSMYQYATRFTAFVLPASASQFVTCQQGLAAIPAAFAANAISSVTVPRLAPYQTLSFGGMQWLVKSAPLRVWPNNNYFATPNAYLDGVGRLHLAITPCASDASQWCSAEVFTVQNVGYGTYSFTVDSPLSSLDPNVTLGLFTWDAQASSAANREWDIEVARWGDPNATTNAQFVVQPYTGPNNLRRFTIAGSAPSTHTVTWNPTSVAFNASNSGGLIDNWLYLASDPGSPPVPTTGDVRLHMNFYIGSGSTPAGFAPQEVIISQFQYTPSAQGIGLSQIGNIMPAIGGSQSVTVNGTAGCTVTAESDSPWLSVISNGVISAGSSVQYSAGLNSNVRRSGHVILTSTNCNATLNAQVLTVTQPGTVPDAQFITFVPPTSQVYGTGPITISATSSSGLTVSVFSSSEGVCTVSGATVTLVGAGTCSLIASQSGDANFSPATPVTRNFLVTTAPQTITFAQPPDASLGSGPMTLTATASSGLAVSFVSGTTGVCTVGGATVTLTSVGTCSITATQVGNANYQSASQVTKSFAVSGPGVNLTVGSGFGVAGQSVELPIQLSTSGTVAPATFQLDLGFDTQRLSYVLNSARMGAQSTAAGKALSAATQPNGSIRLLVSGPNQTPIAPGVVAYASFRLAAGFVAGNSQIVPANCISANGSGAALGTSCGAGLIRYAVCDINLDGTYNVSDVQLIINEALGVASGMHDLNGDGVVTVADVQIVVNSALGLGCAVP